MKTISGTVTSTKPISLSKAAKVLSNFVAAETGASEAVSAYLRRASASFGELVQFHKELKSSKSDRKLKSTNSEGSVKYEQKSEEREVGLDFEDSGARYSAGKKHKKRKNEDVEREVGGSTVIEERDRKRKSGEFDDVEVVDSAEQSSLKKKKKKRRKIEGED